MKLKLLLAVFLSGVLLSSCFTNETFEPEPWVHEFKGPLVKSTLDLSALTNLQRIKFVDNITAAEINPLWDGPAIVPPITGLSSEDNPQIFEATEFFKAIHTDSLVVNVKFTNGYPLIFGKGSDLVFRNQEDQTEFFRHSIERDIDPGEEYEFDIEVLADEGQEPIKVESNIEFYLDNFQSPGTDGGVVDFTNASTNFEFLLEFISVLKLDVYTDKEWGDTVVSALKIFEEGTEEQEYAQGKLTLQLTNGLPVRGRAFIDIEDVDNNRIGQVFQDTLVITPADLDPTTGALNSSTYTELVVPLDFEKVSLFYDEVKLRIMYELNTNNLGTGDAVTVTKESAISVKLIGEFTGYIDKIDLDQ